MDPLKVRRSVSYPSVSRIAQNMQGHRCPGKIIEEAVDSFKTSLIFELKYKAYELSYFLGGKFYES